MTTAAMTPKEHAIQFIKDMITMTPDDFMDKAESVNPIEDFTRQAEAAIPGDEPEQKTARAKMVWDLSIEFRTYTEIFKRINLVFIRDMEIMVQNACINLSILQTLLVRDAFRRTARKAAGWIEEVVTVDLDDEENRQIMLKELNSYMNINLSEKASDSLPLSDKIKMRFPSTIDRIREDVIDQIKAYARCCAAIGIIRHKHFGGEEILVRRNAQTYANLMFGIQANVESFNSYLDVRKTLFNAEWEEEEELSGMSSAIPGEREGLLQIKLEQLDQAAGPGAKNLSKAWMADAKNRAVMSVRSLIVGDRAAFKEYAITRKWIKP